MYVEFGRADHTEGFDFSTEREVAVTVDVASSQSSRGFMRRSEFDGDVVDYTTSVKNAY
ncbi:hypothetical protein OH492_16380 [Vibrio chagasii]|nr:hypothetical protein [Vibrio chagasii]